MCGSICVRVCGVEREGERVRETRECQYDGGERDGERDPEQKGDQRRARREGGRVSRGRYPTGKAKGNKGCVGV